MFKNKVTDVFFDLDHTLWDFEKNSALTYAKILVDYNINVVLDDFLALYVPLNFQLWEKFRVNEITKEELRYQRLRSTFDGLSYSISDDLINRLADEYIATLPTFNFLFNHTITILDYLKSRYKLHIITNGFEEVQERKLVNAKIEEYFTHVINSEMAGAKKPNQKIFSLALKKANVMPQKAIMIGDSLEADVKGAIAFGMHAIHFNSNNETTIDNVVTIDSLHEIKTFL